MNVVSVNNEVFNASVSIQTIDGYFGLVMESRGGAKNSANERNTDYTLALEAILSRLFTLNIKTIKVFLVSNNAFKIWQSMQERVLKIENSIDINLYSDIKTLRKSIGKAQQNKKHNPQSQGGNSTKRILINANLDVKQWESVVLGNTKVYTISEDEINGGAFNPKDAESAKKRTVQLIADRRGQAQFRQKLLSAYNGKCAISATNLPPVLEAAHIVPYQGKNTNHITNGILLRSDFHTLFDFGLIGVNNLYQVIISSSLRDTEYENYHKSNILLPTSKHERPSLLALESRALPYRNAEL